MNDIVKSFVRIKAKVMSILRAAKCKLLRAWHQMDVQVAKYHFESCDNAKFLGAMEKFVHAVYLEVYTR